LLHCTLHCTESGGAGEEDEPKSIVIEDAAEVERRRGLEVDTFGTNAQPLLQKVEFEMQTRFKSGGDKYVLISLLADAVLVRGKGRCGEGASVLLPVCCAAACLLCCYLHACSVNTLIYSEVDADSDSSSVRW
jgi:hypothetical protein